MTKIDIRGHFFKLIRKLIIKTNNLFSTLFTSVELFLKGIDFGKGNSFYGRPIVFRYPYSVIKIGDNCSFRSDKISNLIGLNRKCIISTSKKNAQLIIGNDCAFSAASVSCAQKVFIGNNVIVGANTVISDSDWHNIEPSRRTEYCDSFAPVFINNNVFIGGNVMILKGVTIGENSVIGAQSIVTKDIPTNVIAGGNPCSIIRELKNES